MAYLEVAREGYLAHDALHKGGLTLAVFAHKGNFLAPLDGHVYTGKNYVVAIGLAHSVTNNGIVAAAETGRELQMHGRRVYIVHLDGHYFLQLLDAALHLYSLGGLVAEPLYEVLDVGNFLLLVLIGPQLLFTAFGPEAHILIVLDAIVYHPAATDFQCACGDVVDECPVVANQHHCLGALGEKLLQPLDRLDVEMVGGLVKQQHVRPAQQNFGQLDTHTPTARELAGGAIEVGTEEAQSGEGALHLGFIVFASHHHEAVVLGRKSFHQSHVAIAFIVGAGRQLFTELVDTGFQVEVGGESLARFLTHSGVVGEPHHLWQIADGGVIGDSHHSVGGFLLATENLKHGALAGTVLAYEGNTVVVVDHKRHIMKQRLSAKLHKKVLYRNHYVALCDCTMLELQNYEE